jgi:hypothetical protein
VTCALADVLEAVYKDIGGCLLFSFMLFVFILMFLIPSFLLGHLHHELRNIDYFKLLSSSVWCVFVCSFPSLLFIFFV